MGIALKNAYSASRTEEGYRVLVDRIWPRGVSKARLEIDEWLKEAAPSDKLRKSFHAGEMSWGEFRNAYLSELKNQREELRRPANMAKTKRVTLVFGSRDRGHNNAVVLEQYLHMLQGG